MAFKPENTLESALVAATQDPATAPEFYRLLLDSSLLVPGTVEGHEDADKAFDLGPDSRLNLVPGEANGAKFLPVFTSLRRLQAYVRQDQKYITLNGRGLFAATLGAPIVINPGSTYGKQLAPGEIAQLLDPSAPRREPKTVIGEADYPMALVSALTALFEARPGVTTAWMIQVTFAERAHQPHPLVGVELGAQADDDMAALMQDIERVADHAVPGMVFDVQRVDRAKPSGMADALLQNEPFYQRGKPASGVTVN